MRTAPPVSLRAGGGVLWRGLRFGLPTVAGAVGVYWVLALFDRPTAGVGAAGAVALLGSIATWRMPLAAVELRWDGCQWSVDGQTGAMDVMIDLQDWLLLRLRPADGSAPRWAAVSGAEAGARMPLLRALLHAGPTGPAEATPGAVGPAAPPADR